VFMIESRPNTNCAGECCVVVCTVSHMANMVEARMPAQGSPSSKTVFCTLKVRMMLPIVWCTLSSMAFACGLRAVMCPILEDR